MVRWLLALSLLLLLADTGCSSRRGRSYVTCDHDSEWLDIAPGQTTRVNLRCDITTEPIIPRLIDDREHAGAQRSLDAYHLLTLPIGRTINDVTRIAPGVVDTFAGRSITGSAPSDNAR